MNILLEDSQTVQICPVCQQYLIDDFSSESLCINCNNMISYTILYDIKNQETL